MRIGHLRNGFGRNKTAKINGIKPNFQQFIDVLYFLIRRNEMRPALHGIPGAFH